MAYGMKPKGRDEDGVTYLPIDRSRAAEQIFSKTDPRTTRSLGGVRIGHQPVFMPEEQMPRLAATGVAQACDNIVRGQETYTSLCYLGRSRVEDLPALFEASQSFEIKVRWERLWVLSPFLSRQARSEEGRAALLAGMQEDLAGVHLLSKFAEQNNPAVKRLFARLHDPLLTFLLGRLHEYRDDPRRAALLSGIIGVLETKEEALRKALPPELTDDVSASDVLSLLYVRYPTGNEGKLSALVLRDKLQSWRR